MGQCIVKRKSSFSEEGTKKMRPKEDNETDNIIKSLNEVNDNNTMNVKSLKLTSKFKKYPKKSKLEESAANKPVIKLPINQSLVFITEETKIKLKSPGNLISKSPKTNENSQSLISKNQKKTGSTNIILKNNISSNHSMGIDKRIAFFQNFQEKSSNAKIPSLITLKDISLNSNSSTATSIASNLVKATTKNSETIFVTSKTLTISPKTQKGNEVKICSQESKTGDMIKKKNCLVNKIVINCTQLSKNTENKKDTKQVDGNQLKKSFHINKQLITTKKNDNKVSKQQKGNEKVNNNNKDSHSVFNKKESVTEKTINVLTKRVFKNGKWMEETTKTETLTNEKGTTKVSEKVTFRDLALSELPNPERDTLRPAGMPDSVSSSTVRMPNSTKPQPGKVVPKRDHKPMVKDNPQTFARQVLVATNSYRKLHGVPPLQINDRLNKLAKEWAERLARTEKMEHGDKKDLGENIYCKTSSQPWFEMSGSEVVDNWYSEVDDHDYNEEPSLGFLKTGHFTQSVWKDTKELGVAFARNKNGHMAFVVAYYSPKGNWIGEFREQVLPAGGAQRPQPQNTSKSKVKSTTNKNKNKIGSPKSSNRKKTDRYKLSEVETVKELPSLTSKSRPVTSTNTPDSAGSRLADSPLSYTSRASIFTPRNAFDSAEVRTQSRRDSEFQSPGDSPETRVYDIDSPVSRTNTRSESAFGRTNTRSESAFGRTNTRIESAVSRSNTRIESPVSRTNTRNESPVSRTNARNVRYTDLDYQGQDNRPETRATGADTPASITSQETKANGFDTPASVKSNRSDTANQQSPIRSPPTRVITISPSNSVADENFYEDCLNAHNYYRERHGVESLSLENKLCKYAQEWAKIMADKDMMDHRTDNEYGENIYMKWTSEKGYKIPGEEAVDSWYEEINDYEFGREPTDLSSGHFTQVIWSDSKRLGVGVAKSKSGKIYVVANYDPPGNYLGQFSKKVPPPL